MKNEYLGEKEKISSNGVKGDKLHLFGLCIMPAAFLCAGGKNEIRGLLTADNINLINIESMCIYTNLDFVQPEVFLQDRIDVLLPVD